MFSREILYNPERDVLKKLLRRKAIREEYENNQEEYLHKELEANSHFLLGRKTKLGDQVKYGSNRAIVALIALTVAASRGVFDTLFDKIVGLRYKGIESKICYDMFDELEIRFPTLGMLTKKAKAAFLFIGFLAENGHLEDLL